MPKKALISFFMFVAICAVFNRTCLADVSCEPGNYYESKTGKCAKCANGGTFEKDARQYRMYCSGKKEGNKYNNAYDYRTKCPNGSWPNQNLTGCECRYNLKMKDGVCVGSLTYDDMRYGPDGKNAPLYKQCWIKSTDKEYKQCMGFDTDNVLKLNMKYYCSISDDAKVVFDNQITSQDVASNVGGLIPSVSSICSNMPGNIWECRDNNYGVTDVSSDVSFADNSRFKEFVDYRSKYTSLDIKCVPNDYWVMLKYGCDTSPLINHDKKNAEKNLTTVIVNKDINIQQWASTNGGYDLKAPTVAERCSGNTKKRWKCETFFEDGNYFYLDPSKANKDNSELMNYVNKQSAIDTMRVWRHEQWIDGEILMLFCSPSD